MKTFRILAALLVMITFNIACEQEEELKPVNNPNDLIIGHWTVGELIRGNNVLTNDVSGYAFYCSPGGHLQVTGHGKDFNGNWTCMSFNTDDTVYRIRIMGCNDDDILSDCMDDWHLMNFDSLHCYFTSHDASHQRRMTWERAN